MAQRDVIALSLAALTIGAVLLVGRRAMAATNSGSPPLSAIDPPKDWRVTFAPSSNAAADPYVVDVTASDGAARVTTPNVATLWRSADGNTVAIRWFPNMAPTMPIVGGSMILARRG